MPHHRDNIRHASARVGLHAWSHVGAPHTRNSLVTRDVATGSSASRVVEELLLQNVPHRATWLLCHIYTCICEAPGSTVGLYTDCPEVLGFTRFLQANTLTVP